MKRLFIAVCALALGAALTIDGAEAARLGGGRSVGAQRAAPMQRQAQPAAPAQQSAAKPAQPAPPPQRATAGSDRSQDWRPASAWGGCSARVASAAWAA